MKTYPKNALQNVRFSHKNFTKTYHTLVTINGDGIPHPVVVGGKEQIGNDIAIGIYKMKVTQKNLMDDHRAWVTAATLDGAPKGFRFEGTSAVTDNKVIFVPVHAEVMI